MKNQFLFIIFSMSLFTGQISAQKTDSVKIEVKKKVDSIAKKDKPVVKIKPYKDVITSKAITDAGVFDVHKIEEKYYLEIPDKMLKKEFLLVSRLTKAAAGMRSGMSGYAGDQISQNVVSFEKGPEDKIFMRTISYVDYAKDSTSQMYASVSRNNEQSIVEALEVRAYNKEKKSSVVEITSIINADSDLFSFDTRYKKSFKVGALQKDKSFVNFVKSFPTNIEINTTKTFARTLGNFKALPGMDKPEISGNYTVEINTSLVLLPDNKMQARYFDPRVGFFTVGYTDFDLDPQGVKKVELIKRWRLEPKPEDLEKYKKGELVEPAKPIVFYIDPATPKKWIPSLIQGVNDWQKAFEQAGFKNAIVAKVPNTKDDPEWSLEDARFSGIVYKPSDVPNASGPSIADPRTGEILESHINWYHNVMSLLRNWYFIQSSPNDPRARKIEFDDALMGQLIRFVSSHEVGHTLGLRHNFGSSSTVPVEKLRDNNFLTKNGHTPSIMDYARFNYVAQPEDHISPENLMPRIGDYDKWAIEWGYKRFYNFKTPDSEKTYLNKWVIGELKNNRLWFGTESNNFDPRSQSEQVGDDAMIASNYGVKNLQTIMNNIEKWTAQPNEDYENLGMMYNQVTGQFRRYLGHVSKYIGGEMETPKTQEQNGVVYEVVAKADQKRALEFLNDQIFKTPTWLINDDVFKKTNLDAITVVEGLQGSVLKRILDDKVLDKMYKSEVTYKDAYPLATYLTDLKSDMFQESNPDVYKRNLQRNYVNSLINLINTKTAIADNSDVPAFVRGNLADLKKDLEGKVNDQNAVNRYHYQDLLFRINDVLEPHAK
ncbi:zinc-dependent metalloprotease [Halpernia frigidisoli]|uniref:Zinc-dependent metalloprotease n=1 Tax=Halpernia frigidisoli TaxID=1125876 RepID=A0A1I3GQK3_9FLAO|nr:zinc-dependent metalloprotease [Halpernia frigidisoli]SFI25785.1 protein of unknown function [Halpernia frigidisoli]